MILSVTIKRTIFLAFVILSLLAAVYHLTAIFYKINDSPVWRHVIFVVINLFCTWGFLKRPVYFIYFYGGLMIQQYYSHGQHLINLWNMKHKVDWISLAVLIILPAGLYFLLADFKANKADV